MLDYESDTRLCCTCRQKIAPTTLPPAPSPTSTTFPPPTTTTAIYRTPSTVPPAEFSAYNSSLCFVIIIVVINHHCKMCSPPITERHGKYQRTVRCKCNNTAFLSIEGEPPARMCVLRSFYVFAPVILTVTR